MERRIRLFAKPLPFTCLALICVILTTYIFEEWISMNVISIDFANDASKVVFSGEIWRLYTSFFTHSSILSLLLSIYLLVMEGGAFENRIGSITYLILFTLKQFLVSTLFCVLQVLVEAIFGYSRGHIAGGAWMVILSDLVSRTFANPDETRICRTITNRWYSAILCVLGLILSDFGMQVVAIAGVAAIEFYAFNGLMVRPSRSWILWAENYTCACIAKKTLFFAFVSVEECNASFFKIEQSDRMDPSNSDYNDDEDAHDHFDEESQSKPSRKRSTCSNAEADDSAVEMASAGTARTTGSAATDEDTDARTSNNKLNSNSSKQNMSFYDGNTLSGKLAMEQTYFSKAGFKPTMKNREDCLENVDEDLRTDIEDVAQPRTSIFTQGDENNSDEEEE